MDTDFEKKLLSDGVGICYEIISITSRINPQWRRRRLRHSQQLDCINTFKIYWYSTARSFL